MENEKINLPEKRLPISPLTPEEIREAAQKRVSLITEEFKKGFEFIEKFPSSVTFFGSSRLSEDSPLYARAQGLAKRIVSELGYAVVTGGGPGIMEAGNRGACEAGGLSYGLTIELPDGQAVNPYVTERVGFHYFFSRKVGLSFAAEAYIFFPGGFGTLDEFFEILTLVQTKKIMQVPIILVGNGYWQDMKNFIEKRLLEENLIDNEDLKLFTITDNEEEIMKLIKEAPVRSSVSYRHGKSEKLK